jgi:predicted nucleic-acid-binding Zn-ribbon protein
MAKNPEAIEYEIKGHKLSCPICGNTLFYARKTLLNTRGATFFGLDWANKNADNYICENCGHILWFSEEAFSE